MGKIMINGQNYSGVYTGSFPDAKDQIYDSTDAINITSDNVQDAISELDDAIDDVGNSLVNYLPLTGGTLTNSLLVKHDDTTAIDVSAINSLGKINLTVSSAGNKGLLDDTEGVSKWIIRSDIDGVIRVDSKLPMYAESGTSLKGIDLNTILTPGTYCVAGGSTDLNFPSGVNGLLLVFGYHSSFVRQFFFRLGTINSNDMNWYSRQISDTTSDTPTYGNWKKILSENDLILDQSLVINDGVNNRTVIRLYDDGDTGNYGSEMVIGGNGNTFIGSGESPTGLLSTLHSNIENESVADGESYYGPTGENMIITSDKNVILYSNCNTMSDRKAIMFDTSGLLRPLVTGKASLGSSTYKWNNVYANTFNGIDITAFKRIVKFSSVNNSLSSVTGYGQTSLSHAYTMSSSSNKVFVVVTGRGWGALDSAVTITYSGTTATIKATMLNMSSVTCTIGALVYIVEYAE